MAFQLALAVPVAVVAADCVPAEAAVWPAAEAAAAALAAVVADAPAVDAAGFVVALAGAFFAGPRAVFAVAAGPAACAARQPFAAQAADVAVAAAARPFAAPGPAACARSRVPADGVARAAADSDSGSAADWTVEPKVDGRSARC